MRFPFSLLFLAFAATSLAAEPPDFDKDVASLLVKRCAECHSGVDPKGGLDLMSKSAVLGKDGPVTPGKPEASRLWELVSSDKMPPKKPLPAAEKVLLKEWIAGGA